MWDHNDPGKGLCEVQAFVNNNIHRYDEGAQETPYKQLFKRDYVDTSTIPTVDWTSAQDTFGMLVHFLCVYQL